MSKILTPIEFKEQSKFNAEKYPLAFATMYADYVVTIRLRAYKESLKEEIDMEEQNLTANMDSYKAFDLVRDVVRNFDETKE